MSLPQIAALGQRNYMVITAPITAMNNKPDVLSRPTLFLLTSGHHLAEKHCQLSAAAFTALGWHVVRVFGVDTEKTHVPKGAGPTSWIGWACGALPMICGLMQAEGMTADSVFAVAEDSAWPTQTCTPQRLLDAYCQAIARDPRKRGVWCGSMTKIKKRSFTCTARADGQIEHSRASSTLAPGGSKLFVGSRLLWHQMDNMFRNTPCYWYVDTHWQLMAASGFVEVSTVMLAGTLPHYSARTKQASEPDMHSLRFESELWQPEPAAPETPKPEAAPPPALAVPVFGAALQSPPVSSTHPSPEESGESAAAPSPTTPPATPRASGDEHSEPDPVMEPGLATPSEVRCPHGADSGHALSYEAHAQACADAWRSGYHSGWHHGATSTWHVAATSVASSSWEWCEESRRRAAGWYRADSSAGGYQWDGRPGPNADRNRLRKLKRQRAAKKQLREGDAASSVLPWQRPRCGLPWQWPR